VDAAADAAAEAEARKNFELDEAANVAPPEKVKDADNEDDEQ
jgi:hypothetical protein